MALVALFCWCFGQSAYAQISSLPVPQAHSYSLTFVNDDLVIFQHNDSLIEAYYTIQNIKTPEPLKIQHIHMLDYYLDEGRMVLIYDDNSKITFATSMPDGQITNDIPCAGISKNINGRGFSKEAVLKKIASWK